MSGNRCFVTFTLAISALVFSVSATVSEDINWKEEKGSRFIVCTAGGPTPADKIIEKAEACMDKLIKDLNFSKPVGLWTWENRPKIYVYPKRYDYQFGTHAPNWTAAVALYESKGKIKTISTYDLEDRLLSSILPHQVAHMVMCEFNEGELADKARMPLWLQEGIAQQQEDDTWGKKREAERDLFEKSSNLKFFALWTLQYPPYASTVGLKTTRYTPDPTQTEKLDAAARTFFHKSVSIVSFMISDNTEKRFADFVAGIRKGDKFEECLKTLRGKESSVEEIEKGWQQHVIEFKKRDFIR